MSQQLSCFFSDYSILRILPPIIGPSQGLWGGAGALRRVVTELAKQPGFWNCSFLCSHHPNSYSDFSAALPGLMVFSRVSKLSRGGQNLHLSHLFHLEAAPSLDPGGRHSVSVPNRTKASSVIKVITSLPSVISLDSSLIFLYTYVTLSANYCQSPVLFFQVSLIPDTAHLSEVAGLVCRCWGENTERPRSPQVIRRCTWAYRSISRDLLYILHLYRMIVVLCTSVFSCTSVRPRKRDPASVPLPQLLLAFFWPGQRVSQLHDHDKSEPNVLWS